MAKGLHIHKLVDMWVTWVVMPWIWLAIFDSGAVKWSCGEMKESALFDRKEVDAR